MKFVRTAHELAIEPLRASRSSGIGGGGKERLHETTSVDEGMAGDGEGSASSEAVTWPEEGEGSASGEGFE